MSQELAAFFAGAAMGIVIGLFLRDVFLCAEGKAPAIGDHVLVWSDLGSNVLSFKIEGTVEAVTPMGVKVGGYWLQLARYVFEVVEVGE